MSLQRRFILFLVVFLLSFPCYYSLPGKPNFNIVSKRIDKVGRSLASVKTVNVNHYGAKGDGSDATKVCMHI